MKALSTCSNGGENLSNSTPSIEKPGNTTVRNIAESVPTRSGDQLHRSGLPSFPKSDGTSVDLSGVNYLARPVPDPSTKVSKEVPDHSNDPPCPSIRNPLENPAPDVGTRDEVLGSEAQKSGSNVAASVSDSPTRPYDGKEHVISMGADAMSLHAAGHTGTKITSHLGSVNDLQSAPTTGNSKPAIPTDSGLNDRAYSGPDRSLGPSLPVQRQTPYTSPKPSQVPKQNEPSIANAPSHLSEPSSVTPITPTRKTSTSATTPTRSNCNDHRRSVSSGSGHLNPNSESFIPNTPLSQRRPLPFGQYSWARPFGSPGSDVFQIAGGAPQSSNKARYPEPHQHTPGGQGQYFGTQTSIPSQMPTQPIPPLGPSMPLFFPQIHSPNNNAIHDNAQMYQQGEQNAEYSQTNHFDSYATSQAANAAPNAADLHQNNLYAQDTSGYGPRYYSNHTDPSHQVHSCTLCIDYARLISI